MAHNFVIKLYDILKVTKKTIFLKKKDIPILNCIACVKKTSMYIHNLWKEVELLTMIFP